MRSGWWVGGLAAAFMGAVAACSAGGSGSGSSGGGASGGSGGSNSGGTSDGGSFGGNLNGGLGSGGEADCVATSSEADLAYLPADVILVIDNSESMTDEAAEVQGSMNDFVTTIVGANIDVHVILISADSGDEQGVCVPGPLGSGSCPNDENLPAGFMHVVDSVGSSDALAKVVTNFQNYSSFLRPNATKTIGVISDDNASAGDAATFRADMVALDPSFQDFIFHGIVAPYDYDHQDCLTCFIINGQNCGACDPCCGPDPFLNFACTSYSDGEGTHYKNLAADTNPPGVIGNLCLQEFLPAFQEMATAVIGGSQVACLYDIPTPPNGEDIDYGTVNVEYKETPNGTPELLVNAAGGLADCSGNNEWYYDDPQSPTQILLCPDTCARVQAAAEGKVNVTFGCATVVN